MNNTLYLLTLIIPILLISITLHEVMHAVTSNWLGDDTAKLGGRISFNPLNHIDPFATVALPILLVLFGQPPIAAAKPVQVNIHRVRYHEYGSAIIAVAGPLTNLALAVLGAGIAHLLTIRVGVVADFLYYFIQMNVGLFIFNLIPFPPLDGSRVLYAFAPEPLQELMDSIERFGLMAFLAFFLLLYPSFISPIINHLYARVMAILLY